MSIWNLLGVFMFLMIVLLSILVRSLHRRVKRLELAENVADDFGNEFSAWESGQLKKFAFEYLKREEYIWNIHQNFAPDERRPVRYSEYRSLAEEVLWLKDIVLDSDKLGKAREKFELEREIERKQEELDKLK